MSLVNVAICDFVTELLDEKVPSIEVVKAFKAAVDAEPTIGDLVDYPSAIPTRLVKVMYPIYVAMTETDESRARIHETLESIDTNVGALNVDFITAYFEASKIHGDTTKLAAEKMAALETCMDLGPINNDFYEAEFYSRLVTLYLDDAVANIAKIKVVTPKLRAAVERMKNMPSNFLG